jgi:hypothetical protein
MYAHYERTKALDCPLQKSKKRLQPSSKKLKDCFLNKKTLISLAAKRSGGVINASTRLR